MERAVTWIIGNMLSLVKYENVTFCQQWMKASLAVLSLL